MKEDPEVILLLVLVVLFAGGLALVRPDKELLARATEAAEIRHAAREEARLQPPRRTLKLEFENFRAESSVIPRLSQKGLIEFVKSGDFGTAARLDGQSTVTIRSVTIASEGTWMVWLKVQKDVTTSANMRVIDANAYGIAVHNGAISASFHDGKPKALKSGSKITPGQWTHAALTWGGGFLCLYVDGQLKDKKSYTGAPTWRSRTFVIGSKWTGAGYGFKGDIDELCMFNGCLSKNDILDAMTRGIAASKVGEREHTADGAN